jgi:chromosome segregation ATPase
MQNLCKRLQATSTKVMEAAAQMDVAEHKYDSSIQAAKQYLCSEAMDKILASMKKIKEQDLQVRSLREQQVKLQQQVLETETELGKLQRITDTCSLQNTISDLEDDANGCANKEQAAQVGLKCCMLYAAVSICAQICCCSLQIPAAVHCTNHTCIHNRI